MWLLASYISQDLGLNCYKNHKSGREKMNKIVLKFYQMEYFPRANKVSCEGE